MDEQGRQAVVRGLAALAVATAEAGGSEEQARLAFIQVLRAHGTTDPALVIGAAEAVADPAGQADDPGDDPDLDPEVARQIREAMGTAGPAEQLTAMLRGREWLQRFAADLTG